VIAWNGRSLQGKSFREVYDIITESRLEPQIELVVERKLSTTTTGMTPAGPGPSTPMASRRVVAQSQWRQKHETIPGSQPHHKGDYALGTSRFPILDFASVYQICREYRLFHHLLLSKLEIFLAYDFNIYMYVKIICI